MESCRIEKQSKKALFLKSSKFVGLASLICYVIASFVEMTLGLQKMYLYFFVGLCVATYASYLKIMMNTDPNFSSSCGCNPDDLFGNVLKVLSHKKSALLFNIPNTFFGVMYYSSLITLNTLYPSQFVTLVTFMMSIFSCVGSMYLWYVMVNEVRSVCVLCSTIHAVSLLTLASYA